jgi:phosphoribosylanthranilate isomerase
MRVRAKIDGITRAADAEAAIDAGVDALGFVFQRASPRWIEPKLARDIIARLPPFVAAVGVFVDEAIELVRATVAATGIHIVQFHGNESDEVCATAGVPFIKALRVDGPVDGGRIARQYRHAAALLLDSAAPNTAGGSGQSFDWAWWPSQCDTPLILAGGLRPDNVADAIARTRPFAVDVSSGVEGESKGCKDSEKMQQFIREVQRASQRI